MATKRKAPLDRELAHLRSEQSEITDPIRLKLQLERVPRVPEKDQAALREALLQAESDRTGMQIKLLGRYVEELAVTRDELREAMSETDRQAEEPLFERITEIENEFSKAGLIHALYDVGPPPPTHLLYRGEYQSPMEEVVPGYLAVLCESESTALFEEPIPVNQSSGRRTKLAHWLTDFDGQAGALVARVYVNRVWQHLFGEGLVATEENLGTSGVPPTHPELLEWLAHDFIAGGGHTKKLVRTLVLSAAYRQVSRVTDDNRRGLEVDPANRLLWRMRLRQLESEIVRDSILSASGKLDTTMGGPALMLELTTDGRFVIKEEGLPTPTAKFRRSIYILARRNYHHSMLAVFDQPILSTNCMVREPSAVVLQSLAMLNDEFVIEQARLIAERIEKSDRNSTKDKSLEAAFEHILCRAPDDAELAWSQNTLTKHEQEYRAAGKTKDEARTLALADICHALVNSSEFLYVP